MGVGPVELRFGVAQRPQLMFEIAGHIGPVPVLVVKLIGVPIEVEKLIRGFGVHEELP